MSQMHSLSLSLSFSLSLSSLSLSPVYLNRPLFTRTFPYLQRGPFDRPLGQYFCVTSAWIRALERQDRNGMKYIYMPRICVWYQVFPLKWIATNVSGPWFFKPSVSRKKEEPFFGMQLLDIHWLSGKFIIFFLIKFLPGHLGWMKIRCNFLVCVQTQQLSHWKEV